MPFGQPSGMLGSQESQRRKEEGRRTDSADGARDQKACSAQSASVSSKMGNLHQKRFVAGNGGLSSKPCLITRGHLKLEDS